MEIISSIVHQDVLAIKGVGDLIFAGTGGILLVYKASDIVTQSSIFLGQKIHLIQVIELDSLKLIVVGGKHVAFCCFKDKVVVVWSLKCDDWILDAAGIEGKIVLVTAHNQAQLRDQSNGLLIAQTAPLDRCILYSAKIHGNRLDEILVLAGTVYSEVILWKPDFSNSTIIPSILCRLIGHKGVIFSIAIRETMPDSFVVCTTSDDRSVRLWYMQNLWDAPTISETPPLFGHAARVWRSLLLEDCVISVGEDSAVCVWNYTGELRSKLFLHDGGGIRGLDYDAATKVLITGGGDGGILVTPWTYLDQFSVTTTLCLSDSGFLEPKEIPRKVIFSDLLGATFVTDKGRLFGSNITGSISLEDFKLCTDLSSTNCGNVVALCNRLSKIFIVDSSMSVVPLSIKKNDTVPCEKFIWRDNYLLVHRRERELELYYLLNHTLNFKGSFILPKQKGVSPACFLFVKEKNILLIGDRLGGLHMYSTSGDPVSSLNLHSCLGVSDIFQTDSNKILTVGAGGWLRNLSIVTNELKFVKSTRIPIEIGSKIIEIDQDTLILGFHSTDLQIYSLQSKCLLGSYRCGGGHRSYDFQIDRHLLKFLYVKDKRVNSVSLHLSKPISIRNSYHGKTINALEMIHSDVVISGGEDCGLRLCQISGRDIVTKCILEQHISSVRAISVVSVTDSEYLIVSVGGREQIVLTSYNVCSGETTDLMCHFANSSSAEGRHMCLATEKISSSKILILIGCSDCSLRLFTYDCSTLIKKCSLQYHRCILKVSLIKTGSLIFAVAFATDGKATFWDISDACSDDFSPSSSVASLELHSSGINSVVVRHIDDYDYLFVTGGDDNKLSIAIVQRHETSWSIKSVWGSSDLHSCQITGLALHKNLLLTTSIDQRLFIFKLSLSCDPPIEKLFEKVSTTPDIHGMTIFNTSNELSIILYGKGIECFVINLDKLS